MARLLIMAIRAGSLHPVQVLQDAWRGRQIPWAVLVLLTVLAGCSGSAPVVVDDPVDLPSGPSTWSEVEEVDMNDYPDVIPQVDQALVHDVPQSLMNSTADDGTAVELDGYRVQVFSSSEREEAVRVEDAVQRWLNGLSDGQRNALGLSDAATVYSFYRPPFYRIRVGDFEKRENAARLATTLQRQWPGALVVPDRVTIIR